MQYLAFLLLALKRVRERWGLTLLSVIGITLTVGILGSIPIFTDSVGFQILDKELAKHSFGNANPPMAMRFYRQPNSPEPMTVQQALDMGDWLGAMTARWVGLPVGRSYYQIGSHALMVRALPEDERYKNKELRQVRIDAILHVEDQIEIVDGRPFAEADSSNELLLWGQPKFLNTLGVQVGDVFELFNYNAVHPDQPLRFRVAGTWRAKDPEGAFWYRNPESLLEEELLTSMGAFGRFVAPFMPQQTDFNFWYIVLDEGHIRFDRVDTYTTGAEVAQQRAESAMPGINVDRTPIQPLKDVQIRTRVLSRLLYGFSLPVVVLILFFLTSISTIIVRYQQNEVAVFRSRGTSVLQVLGISTLEGLIAILIGTPLGVMASVGLARLMNLNSSFLTFDRSVPLKLATQALDWRLVALGLAVSLLTRLIPVLRATQATIVTWGRERARARAVNIALRLLLTTFLVAAAAYAYNQLHVRGTLGLVSWEPSGQKLNDPLVFLAPALFIFAAAWLISQVFPLLMLVPDLLGSLLPSTSLFLGFRNLARQSSAYTVPMFLLTVCLCLGAFEASIARSADRWLLERWQYKVGADFNFYQGVDESGVYGMSGRDAWLLPVEQYRKLPGAMDATRIGAYVASPTLTGRWPKMQMLAIDRLDFPRVAYYRPDYAQESLGELLNRLGTRRDGILVTRAFLKKASLNLGDKLEMNVSVELGVQTVSFVIVGTFDQFPTMFEKTASAVVANLEYVHDQFGGPQPHNIWMRIAPDIDTLVLKENLRKMGVLPVDDLDLHALVAEDRDRLERVGIFGNLTVGFLAGSLLAWLGLLVYTFASLQGSVRRFTILRALGLRMRQVLATVSVEYLVVIAYGILAGAAAGVATSYLFVPYFQFTDDPTNQVPSFVPEIAWMQILWIIAAYFVVLAVAEIIVLLRATRREVFQALRLGDEE